MVQLTIEKESRSQRTFSVAQRGRVILIRCLLVRTRIKLCRAIFHRDVHQTWKQHCEVEIIKLDKLFAVCAAILKRVAVTMPVLLAATGCRKDYPLIVGEIIHQDSLCNLLYDWVVNDTVGGKNAGHEPFVEVITAFARLQNQVALVILPVLGSSDFSTLLPDAR